MKTLISNAGLSFVVICVAGFFSLIVLLTSKILLFLKKNQKNKVKLVGGYECGFEHLQDGFAKHYRTEYNSLISLFIVIEIGIAWFVLCSIFQVSENLQTTLFNKIFLSVIFLVISIFGLILKKYFLHQ